MKIVSIRSWIARDKSNELYMFNYKPQRTDGIFIAQNIDNSYHLPNNIFPELSWKNGAIQVEVIIKKL